MRDLVRQKIIDSQAEPLRQLTRRDVHIPRVGGKAVAVVGPRRAGKTSLMWQVMSDRAAAGTSRQEMMYFSFEDERLADMKAADLGLLVEEFYRLHPRLREKRRVLWLLDEIQVVSGWEAYARRLADTEKVELFLSGSSARLLSREVATSMRGRAMEALVLPFSFREHLRHRGIVPAGTTGRRTKAERSVLQRELTDYLVGGGFPEAQGATARDRMELLRGYVDTALLRDVIERYAVANPVALRWLVRHLLGNAGGTFSVSKFHADLRGQGIPVAKDTLHQYLGHLQDAFLVRVVSVATASERRRMVNPRKIYPVDPGLIPLFDRSGKANLGHALETAVALELERRGAKIGYVRTRQDFEVDFLARYPDGRQELIQVCADLDQRQARDREFRSLAEAAAEHPRATLHVIVLACERFGSVPEHVALHRAEDWLAEVAEG